MDQIVKNKGSDQKAKALAAANGPNNEKEKVGTESREDLQVEMDQITENKRVGPKEGGFTAGNEANSEKPKNGTGWFAPIHVTPVSTSPRMFLYT